MCHALDFLLGGAVLRAVISYLVMCSGEKRVNALYDRFSPGLC